MDTYIDAVHALALVKNRMRFHRDPETGWDKFWQGWVQRNYRRLYPKRKLPTPDKPRLWAKAMAMPGAQEMWQILSENVRAMTASMLDQESNAHLQVIRAANKVEVQPSATVWSIIGECDTHTYSSQGYGDHKYTRSRVEEDADKARALGLEVHVTFRRSAWCKDKYNSYGTYQAWANVDPHTAAVVMDKSDDLSWDDWLKTCVLRHVNPKARNPFLPQWMYDRWLELHRTQLEWCAEFKAQRGLGD